MVQRPPAPLVGRETSLGELRSALRRAGEGLPSLVLLTGETGVGKTRLVRELLADDEVAALAGACVPMAGDPLPFAPLTQGLRRLAGSGVVRQQLARSPALARLLPGGSGAVPTGPGDGAAAGEPNASGQLELFQGVLDLLGLLGAAHPAVHLVEDLHWADRSTLDLLRFLAVNLSTERVVIVATYRADAVVSGSPLASWLAEVGRLDVTTRIALDRLGPEDTRSLVQDLLGHVPEPAVLESALARSAGNPLFVEHLVLQGTTNGPLPDTLRELLAARIAGLPSGSQRLLRASAVLGRAVTVEVLAATLEESVPAVEEQLRPALDQHILEHRADGRIGFRHPAFAEVGYAALLPTEGARLHRAAALALERDATAADLAGGGGGRLEARSAELARHWLRAGDLPRALEAAVASGQQAERLYAFADAQSAYARAAELALEVPSRHDRGKLLGRAAGCASLVGDSAEAIRLGEAAVELAEDPLERASLCERLATFHYIAGRGDESEQWFREALALLPEGSQSVLAARALAGLALFAAAWSRLDDAREWSAQALEMARATGARREEGRAENAAGLVAASAGDPETGAAHLRVALAIATEVGNPDELAGAYVNLSHVLGLGGHHDEVVEVCREGAAALNRVGLGRQSGSLLRANACEALITSGRLDEARVLVSEVLAQHPRGLIAAPVLMQAGRLALHSGELAEAWDLCEQARLVMEAEGAPDAWLRESIQLSVAVELWSGRPTAAYDLVIDGLHLVEGTDEEAFGGTLVTLGIRALADEAEAHRDAATRARLDARARPLLEVATRTFDEGPAAAAQESWRRAEQARLGLRSDPDLWSATAQLWAQAHQPFPAAYARWREAEARLDARADAAAIDALRAAGQAALACGAVLLQKQVELLATWHRIELGVLATSPTSAASAGDDAELGDPGSVAALTGSGGALDAYGLTARELEVLARLAAGRTNGEIARELFISAKTASVHVSNILRKLDVSGRQEAARVAHRLGVRVDQRGDA